MKEFRSFIDEDRGEGGSKRIVSIGEVGLGMSSYAFLSASGAHGQTTTGCITRPGILSSNTSPTFSDSPRHIDSLSSSIPARRNHTSTSSKH